MPKLIPYDLTTRMQLFRGFVCLARALEPQPPLYTARYFLFPGIDGGQSQTMLDLFGDLGTPLFWPGTSIGNDVIHALERDL